jgi:signal peptidase I
VGTSTRRRSLLALIVAVLVAATLLGAGVFLLLQHTRTLPAFIQPLLGRRSVHILGDAMAPTLRDGQYVSVDIRAFAHHPPQHGDIVLFTPPTQTSLLFIKRIIAIPGDRLLITNGSVSINGGVIGESYLAERWIANNSWPADGQAVTVPPNEYFVMGDNRNHSSDSRAFGFVSLEAIQGKLLPSS